MKRPTRPWKAIVIIGVLLAVALFGYTPARQFHRFFLTECAADGPARETELDIDPQPVDLAKYYADLRVAAEGLAIREIAQVEYRGERWPILLIGPTESAAKASLLVVAGVHGNEVSGSLAAIEILKALRGGSDRIALHVVAPANPVGLKFGSRYNPHGCDINRDFKAFRTLEAQALRTAIDSVKPVAVVSLHEGPQDGIFAIGTNITSSAWLDAIAAGAQSRGFALAQENNLGMELDVPGMMAEGRFITRAKGWLGIYSLGEHTTGLGIPLVTTEAPWRLPSMQDRIAMQVLAVNVVLDQLSRK